MEELTKTQIILLTLLISFITSIATGIVTVSLLDQAPLGVTQTINRVIERTVEKVVPGQEATVITRETTVIIREENLIVEAVDRNSKSLVRISLSGEEGTTGTVLGLGVFISQDGYIATDVLNLSPESSHLIETFSGKVYAVTVEYLDQENGMAFLKVVQPKDLEEPQKFSKPSFGDSNSTRLGQTIVAIGGNQNNVVLSGIISEIVKKTVSAPTKEGEEPSESKGEAPEISVVSSLISNLNFTPSYSGGPLMDVDGFLLGINIVRKTGDYTVPVSTVLDTLSVLREDIQTIETE